VKKRIPYLIALAVLLLLGTTGWALVAASDYTLVCWTVDGGGSTFHTAGGYSLGGTTGQPDARAWSGGAYTLDGGFWGAGGTGEQYAYVYLPLVIKE
jgi:hypothetical protein